MSADRRLMVQVCICTHNPRPDVFDKVLAALRHQTRPDAFGLVIVDNASHPPIETWACRDALGPDIPLRIERENALGVTAARARAVEVTTTNWVLFVDDDTELAPDYIERGLAVIAANPTIGCFGGKLVLPNYLRPSPWTRPLLPFLAIKDIGDEPMTSMADEWRSCEPPTAGAFVSRPVLERFRSTVRGNRLAQLLGRKGHKGLRSGEDALMMRGAYALGLSVSYQPSLKLVHHLNPRRLRFNYLVKLMWGHGRTLFVLDRIVASARPRPSHGQHRSAVSALRLLFRAMSSEIQKSIRYACCMLAFRLGYRWDLIVPKLSFSDLGVLPENADQKSEG